MKDLVELLLTPPGMSLILGVVALYYFRAKPGRARKFLVLSLVLGWAFSTEVVGRYLSTAIISQIEGTSPADMSDVDIIVAPTGGMEYLGQAGWAPTQTTYNRVMVAYDLQARVGSRTPILISGGKTKGLRYPSEAKVAQQTIDRLNAQITPVLLEENSLNTFENARESARIIRERNARTVFLVTSEIHMLRALAAFRARGIDPVPFPIFTLRRGDLNLESFLPTARGVEVNNRALYEILGILYYLIADHVRWEDVFYETKTSK